MNMRRFRPVFKLHAGSSRQCESREPHVLRRQRPVLDEHQVGNHKPNIAPRMLLLMTFDPAIVLRHVRPSGSRRVRGQPRWLPCSVSLALAARTTAAPRSRVQIPHPASLATNAEGRSGAVCGP